MFENEVLTRLNRPKRDRSQEKNIENFIMNSFIYAVTYYC